MNSLLVSIQSVENLQILKRLNFCSYSDSPEALIAFTYSQQSVDSNTQGTRKFVRIDECSNNLTDFISI